MPQPRARLGRSRISSVLLVGLVVLALSAAGCTGDSDDTAPGETTQETPTAETGAEAASEAGSGTEVSAPDREAAVAAIADAMTVLPPGPGVFFSPGEAQCLAERIVDEIDPAIYADLAADPDMEAPAGQPDIDTAQFVPECVDSLARFEEMMTASMGAETAACMTAGAGVELAYAIAVGPFFGEDISPEHQGEQADLFEICSTNGGG